MRNFFYFGHTTTQLSSFDSAHINKIMTLRSSFVDRPQTLKFNFLFIFVLIGSPRPSFLSPINFLVSLVESISKSGPFLGADLSRIDAAWIVHFSSSLSRLAVVDRMSVDLPRWTSFQCYACGNSGGARLAALPASCLRLQPRISPAIGWQGELDLGSKERKAGVL